MSLLLAPALALAAKHSCDTSSPQRRVLKFDGGIVANEADRFDQSFATCFPPSYRGQVVIDLHSGGGLVDEALRIANTLIDQGQGVRPVHTRISRGSYCISACTYLYVAGRFREAESGASFEPHGFSSYRSQRIDLVMDQATEEGLDAAAQNLGGNRLKFLGLNLKALYTADERFAWLGPLLADYTRTDGRIRRDALQRLVTAYGELKPNQQALLATLDSIVTIVMTELERTAALKAFGPLLQRGSTTAPELALVLDDEQRFLQWMSGEFLVACNGYIAATKTGPRPADLGPSSSDLMGALRARARDTMETATNDLWPYLARRNDVLDVAGLVRLMFSTSIIYTRPLTREEMCDLNIVNRGCD